MFRLEVDDKDLERAKKLLQAIPKAYSRAISRAISRTIEGMRTDAIRLTLSEYRTTRGNISKTLRMHKTANAAEIISRGKRLSLIDYHLSPKRMKASMYQGAVRQNGDKNLPGAFLIRLNGKLRPYIRVGKKRWDIKPLISPAIPQILANPIHYAELERLTGERFKDRLNHEVMRELGVFAL